MNKVFLKNTNGQPSASFTMAFVSFVVCTGWLLAWLVLTPWGINVPEFDVATASGFMLPLLSLYFGRRITADVSEKKIKIEMQEQVVEATKSGKDIRTSSK